MIRRSKSGKTMYEKFKEEYKYLKTSWSVQTKEFFENSTLHGVKYIVAKDRPFIERFVWFICVISGAVATCAVILSLWQKFQTNPTITGLDTDFHNWQIPFPAIMLCPEEPARMEKIKRILEISENSTLPDDNATFFYDLSRLNIKSLPDFVKKYSENIPFLEDHDDIRNVIFKFMDDCRDLFPSCILKGQAIDCCDMFFPVFTEIGFCHSFNSRHFEKNDSTAELNMQYIEETDIKWSLWFEVTHMDKPTPLYMVNSDEMIGIDVQPQLIWDYKVFTVSFSIKQTYTTQDTRQLSIKQRRCVFEDEIKLEDKQLCTCVFYEQRIDNTYTYTACAMECRMKNAKSLCGCVPYFYPAAPNFPSCTTEKLYCIANNLEKIKNVDKCDCQLGCKNTVYEIEAINWIEGTTKVSDEIEMEFSSWPMAKYKREVLFGWVDLLVSFGGIAGLFLGFSLVSGVEVIYYFIIRAGVASFRERKGLDRVRKEVEAKPKPSCDLSLVPYFISEPLPGHGIDEVVKRNKGGYGRKLGKRNYKIKPGNHTKNMKKWAISHTINPPFGIEFVN